MGLDMYIQDRDGSEYVYWRKANAINDWFDRVLDGVENVTPYEVNKEILEALLNDCKRVLELLKYAKKIYNERNHHFYTYSFVPSEVFEIMPPMTGLFFGTYDIDEWYEDSINATIRQIEPLLEFHDFNEEPLYYYIWF